MVSWLLFLRAKLEIIFSFQLWVRIGGCKLPWHLSVPIKIYKKIPFQMRVLWTIIPMIITLQTSRKLNLFLFVRVLVLHYLKPFIVVVLSRKIRIKRFHKSTILITVLLFTPFLNDSVILARIFREPKILWIYLRQNEI